MEQKMLTEPNISDTCEEEDSEELEEISDDETEDEINVTSMYKNTNLHFSAALGIRDNVLRDLESPDQKIDAENFMGWTPLMMAVRNGRVEAVKILLERGADITKKNQFGVNIFTMSVANGNVDMIEIILQHMLRGGISRNRIQENLSPISVAILFRKTQLLNWLIDQGFDLNAATCKTNLSPLMFAAVGSTDTTVHMLESRGANKNHKNYMGLNYREMILWRNKGLHHLKNIVVVKQESAIETDTVIQIIVTSPPNSITKPDKHLLQVNTPKRKETDTDITPPEVKYRVPNNTPCIYPAPHELPVPPQLSKLLSFIQSQPPINDTKFTVPQTQFQYQYPPQGPTNKVHQYDLHHNFSNAQMSSSGVRQKNIYQTPSDQASSSSPQIYFSPQYQNIVRTLNDMPQNSPIAFISYPQNSYQASSSSTQICFSPQYQNIVRTHNDLPQNSPIAFIPSPQNVYQASPSSPQIYYSPQEIPQISIENSQNPNGFYNNSVFDHFISPL